MTEAPGGYRFYLIDKELPNCGGVFALIVCYNRDVRTSFMKYGSNICGNCSS